MSTKLSLPEIEKQLKKEEAIKKAKAESINKEKQLRDGKDILK